MIAAARRVASAALGSPSAAGAALLAFAGWLALCAGLGLRFGWWLTIVGVGLGACLAGLVALLVQIMGAYFQPEQQPVAEGSAGDTVKPNVVAIRH